MLCNYKNLLGHMCVGQPMRIELTTAVSVCYVNLLILTLQQNNVYSLLVKIKKCCKGSNSIFISWVISLKLYRVRV